MGQTGNRGSKLFCWVFILVGVAAMVFGVVNLVRALRCKDWPVTDGVVLTADMKVSTSDNSSTYSAAITYKYRVAGRNFTGERLAYGTMSSSVDYARGILDRYPVGRSVPVHYSPADPQEAVLETGIHGGMWVCFGVGTIFVLAGTMFLRLQTAAAAPVEIRNANVDTNASTQRPPVLMGVIFMLMGSFVCFGSPSGGTPPWILYVAGGMFVVAGLGLLLMRLENKVYSQIAFICMGLTLLAIFHWVSFAPGQRIGTSSTPFSMHSGVNVKTPFALFTIFFDLVIVTILVAKVVKRRKD